MAARVNILDPIATFFDRIQWVPAGAAWMMHFSEKKIRTLVRFQQRKRSCRQFDDFILTYADHESSVTDQNAQYIPSFYNLLDIGSISSTENWSDSIE